MANELRHKTVGEQLTQVEFEDTLLHTLNSQATGDLIIATSATQLSRLAKITTGEYLKATGTGYEGGTPATGATTSGSYTGNDTQNRTIAHGLGVVPKLVFLGQTALDQRWIMMVGLPTEWSFFDLSVVIVVTAMTTTNLYVGNADPWITNKSGITYYWVAIG